MQKGDSENQFNLDEVRLPQIVVSAKVLEANSTNYASMSNVKVTGAKFYKDGVHIHLPPATQSTSIPLKSNETNNLPLIWNVPDPVKFIGREDELRELKTALESDPTRAITQPISGL